MDMTAFFKLTNGLYIVSSSNGEKDAGCIVNTVLQVTAEPPRLSVTVNKQNATADVIRESGYFAATVLTETADMGLIGTFGFRSSREENKFSGFATQRDENGMPYGTEHTAAWFSVKVEQTVDVDTHWMFIGEVTEAEKLLPEHMMSYEYYHSVVKGGTPKNAPSYQAGAMPPAPAAPTGERWRCTVCGYIHEGPLPEGFTCPLCGVGTDSFEKIEEAPAKEENERWRCTVCGYIHEGPLPEGFACPICKVGADKFEKIEEAPAKEENERWRCTVCGYIHEGPLPEGFACPLCGVGADQFERLS